MSVNKLKKLEELGISLNHGEKIPNSRREFLSSGLIALSTMAIAPGLLMSPTSVMAEAAAESTLGIGFLGIEGAGGMNFAGGNVMVGFGEDEEQENFGVVQNLSDYILLGLPASMHPSKSGMLNNEYGLVFHSTSGILAGLNEVLTPDLKDAIDGIVICGRTADDSADNPINVAFQAQRSGAKGKLVQLIGNSGTPSGSRSPAVSTQIRPELQASRITKFSEGSGLLSIGDDAINPSFFNLASADGKGTARIQSFLSSIMGLSKTKFESAVYKQKEIAQMTKTQQASNAVFKQFSPLSLNPVNDPVLLTKIQQAFGGTGMNVVDEGVAAVANLVTEKIAGVGSLTVGGCDYHNATASSGQAKDAEIGRYIGKCIKLAALKGQNLFIHLYTDGGVGGDNAGTLDETPAGAGRVIWVGDNGTTSCQICIVYKHNHKRSVMGSLLLPGKTRQIGYFRQGGGINLTATSVSNNIDQMWKAVILNYLACMSNEAPDKVIEDVKKKFSETFPGETLPSDYEKLIRFKSMVA